MDADAAMDANTADAPDGTLDSAPRLDATLDVLADAGDDAMTDGGTDAARDAAIDAGRDASGDDLCSPLVGLRCDEYVIGSLERPGVFGYALAIAEDGTVLTAAYDENRPEDAPASTADAINVGSAYLVTADGSGGFALGERFLHAADPDRARFGLAVALSADASVVAVGAPWDASSEADDPSDTSLERAGSVHVFRRAADGYTLEAYLKAPVIEEAGEFGFSVGMSADGRTLAVGHSWWTTGGAVTVLRREGGTWRAVTTIENEQPGRFGGILALSRDGGTLAVGAISERSAGVDDRGAVYVYRLAGDAVERLAVLRAPVTSGRSRCGQVAVSEDGSVIAVGCDGDATAGAGVNPEPTEGESIRSGAVYVYVREGDSYAQDAFIKAAIPRTDDRFGESLSLSADGATLAVSAPQEGGSGAGLFGDSSTTFARDDNSGAVYVFARAGGSWTERLFLKSLDARRDFGFGKKVALSPDGRELYVHERGGSTTGTLYGFRLAL